MGKLSITSGQFQGLDGKTYKLTSKIHRWLLPEIMVTKHGWQERELELAHWVANGTITERKHKALLKDLQIRIMKDKMVWIGYNMEPAVINQVPPSKNYDLADELEQEDLREAEGKDGYVVGYNRRTVWNTKPPSFDKMTQEDLLDQLTEGQRELVMEGLAQISDFIATNMEQYMDNLETLICLMENNDGLYSQETVRKRQAKRPLHLRVALPV